MFGTFQSLIDTRGVSKFKTAHGVLTAVNTISKSTVNSVRFIPLYILTLGSYKTIHNVIDTGVNLLYQGMDIAGVFNIINKSVTTQ